MCSLDEANSAVVTFATFVRPVPVGWAEKMCTAYKPQFSARHAYEKQTHTRPHAHAHAHKHTTRTTCGRVQATDTMKRRIWYMAYSATVGKVRTRRGGMLRKT